MVSVIPGDSPSELIGKIMGQGVAQNFPHGLERGINRGMLQNSLDEINSLGKQENANPLEMMTKLMKAGAGIPGSERYLGQLYPMLMQQMQGNKMSQMGGPGQTGDIPQSPQAQPNQMGQGATGYSQEKLPIPLPEPTSTPYGAATSGIDLGEGPVPKTYSPEEYATVENEYRKNGLDPAPAVNQMKLRDDVARNQLNDMVKGAQTVSSINDLRAQQQAREKSLLAEKMPGLTPEQMTVAEKIAQKPELRQIKNESLRADRVKKEFDLYQRGVNNFESASQRSHYEPDEYKRQMSQLGNYVKPMVEMGQRDEAEKILSEGGWGPTERSMILNPLDESARKNFATLPKIKPIEEQINVLPDDPMFDVQAKKAIDRKNESLQRYKDTFAKDFKTGHYDPQNSIKPGTSLLQMRDLAMQHGASWQDVEKMVNELVGEGKIKLDPYQQSERIMLGQPIENSFGIGEIIWRLNPLYKARK